VNPYSGALWLTDRNNQIQIERLPLPWEGLDDLIRSAFSRYEERDLQLGLDWLSNLAATALKNTDIAVLLIARTSPDNFIAMPLKLDTGKRHASSLSTFYSSLYSPIIHTSTPDVLLNALFHYLVHTEKVATIVFSPMDVDSPSFGLIQAALASSGWKGIHRFFCFGNWTENLEQATYQSYWATRSSQLRNTVTRRTRQFTEAGRGTLVMVTGGNMLDESVEQFIAIYNRSWKRPEPYPEFIPQLLRLSARRGWLRLGIARYDGNPAAAQIWLVSQKTAYIFKLAYDENYKQLSPGTVLTAFMMEYVIERDGVTSVDYLSGDDAYKKDWMSQRRERYGIAAYNVRSLRGAGLLLGRKINNFIKSFRTRNRD